MPETLEIHKVSPIVTPSAKKPPCAQEFAYFSMEEFMWPTITLPSALGMVNYYSNNNDAMRICCREQKKKSKYFP